MQFILRHLPLFANGEPLPSLRYVTTAIRRLFLESAPSFGQNLIEELADRSLRFQY
jgi:hypothetical protein